MVKPFFLWWKNKPTVSLELDVSTTQHSFTVIISSTNALLTLLMMTAEIKLLKRPVSRIAVALFSFSYFRPMYSIPFFLLFLYFRSSLSSLMRVILSDGEAETNKIQYLQHCQFFSLSLDNSIGFF